MRSGALRLALGATTVTASCPVKRPGLAVTARVRNPKQDHRGLRIQLPDSTKPGASQSLHQTQGASEHDGHPPGVAVGDLQPRRAERGGQPRRNGRDVRSPLPRPQQHGERHRRAEVAPGDPRHPHGLAARRVDGQCQPDVLAGRPAATDTAISCAASSPRRGESAVVRSRGLTSVYRHRIN